MIFNIKATGLQSFSPGFPCDGDDGGAIEAGRDQLNINYMSSHITL